MIQRAKDGFNRFLGLETDEDLQRRYDALSPKGKAKIDRLMGRLQVARFVILVGLLAAILCCHWFGMERCLRWIGLI